MFSVVECLAAVHGSVCDGGSEQVMMKIDKLHSSILIAKGLNKQGVSFSFRLINTYDKVKS